MATQLVQMNFYKENVLESTSLKEYQNFVESVTSEASDSVDIYIERLKELTQENSLNVNIPLLLTGATGMGSESGEFQEIVKKILFQGKPLSSDSIVHMKRELGDIIFYWVNACRALDMDPNAVIEENINKLSSRYPGGFSVEKSENRKPNDL